MNGKNNFIFLKIFFEIFDPKNIDIIVLKTAQELVHLLIEDQEDAEPKRNPP